MSWEFWLVYCGTIFVASIIRGPSMLLALTHGIRYGLKRSLMTAAGNATASGLQAAIALTGLGAILFASEWVFQIIKWAGAAYLIYIGFMMWRSPGLHAGNSQSEDAPTGRGWNLFRQAFIVAMGNPKAVVFFTALFPQFISQAQPGFLFYSAMTISLTLIAFICMMIYSIGGLRLAGLIRSARVGKLLSKTVGGLFVGGGLSLAASSR